jgi:hypothetical protein
MELVPQMPPRRAYKGGRAAPDPPKKCAWVVLLMIGKAYAPGALVVAQSLRAMKTKHDLVCMVTDDVPPETRAQLRGTAQSPIYDAVIEVPYVAQRTRPFEAKKQAELYGGWIDRSFTKWNCLTLTQYDRVILVDADVVAVTNCDDLFELRPPAACYSNPWAYPWQVRGGLTNPYLKCAPGREASCDLPHGTRVPASQIEEALRTGSFVGWGAMVLLEPSAAKYKSFLAMLHANTVFGEDYNAISGSDEISIAAFYAREAGGWTHIHQRYIAIPWKRNWVSRDIRAYHFHGRKPWDMEPDEWPDLADWWKVAERLVAKHPGLRPMFYPEIVAVTPLDGDVAQLRVTNDLRAMIVGRAKERGRHRDKADAWRVANAILGRWLMALVNSKPGTPHDWARVYHHTTLEDAFNNTLAGDLLAAKVASPDEVGAMVTAMLALVDGRLGRFPRPTGASPACDGEALTYGSHFTMPAAPRVRQLVALGGCDKAAAAVVRHAVVLGELQGCIRQAHADHLYAKHGVRNEAFASPLDARLFGKEGAAYFSAFPDTDAAFGSSGDFFAADDPFRLHPGNWLVHPPPAGEVVIRAARAVADAMSLETPRTVFFLAPDNGGEASAACEILRDSPFYAAELQFEARAAILETPAGEPLVTDAPYAYIALSSEGFEVRASLEATLSLALA